MSQQLRQGKMKRASVMHRLANSGRSSLGIGAVEDAQGLYDDPQGDPDADNEGGHRAKRNQSRSPPTNDKPRSKRVSRGRTKDPLEPYKEAIETEPRLLRFIQTELDHRPEVEARVAREEALHNRRLQESMIEEGEKRAEAKRVLQEADEIHEQGKLISTQIERCSYLKRHMVVLSNEYPLAWVPLNDIRMQKECVDFQMLGAKSANKKAAMLHDLLLRGICYNNETREFVRRVTEPHYIEVYVSVGLFEIGATSTRKVLRDTVGDGSLFKKGPLLNIRIAALLGIPHDDLVVGFEINPKTSRGSPLGKLAKRMFFKGEGEPEEQQNTEPEEQQLSKGPYEENQVEPIVEFELPLNAKRMWDAEEVQQFMGDEPFPNPNALVSLSFAGCSLTSEAVDAIFQWRLLPNASMRCLANVTFVDVTRIGAHQDKESIKLAATSMATNLSRYCPRVTTLLLGYNPWDEHAALFCKLPNLESLDLTCTGIKDLRPIVASIGENAKNMRSIRLCYNQAVTEDCSIVLQEFLPICLELTKFEIGAPPPDDDGDMIEHVDIGNAMGMLEHPEKLQHLKLIYCYIGSNTLASACLINCINLQSLSLFGCVFPDCAHLAAVFRSIERKPLQTIDFSHCLECCSSGGTEEQKDGASIEELTIWGSQEDNESLLASALNYFRFCAFPMLKELKMAGLQMNDYVALALLDAIGFSTSLEKLDFSANPALTKETAKAIAKAIETKRLPALKHVDLQVTEISDDEEACREIGGHFPDHVIVLLANP